MNTDIQNSPQTLSRRAFLRNSIFGASASATLPAFLGQAFLGMDAYADSLGSETGGPVVVILQMAGGNDSLNTVIPYASPDAGTYYAARPTLAIPADKALPLSGGLGLHPSLPFLRSLWDQGDLAVINGVGYPNPNLSHFRSMDFWHTATPGDTRTDGWLGRYFDHACAGSDPNVGIEFARDRAIALRHHISGLGITVESPETFEWIYSGNQETPDTRARFREMVGLDHPFDDGISIADPTLAYVQRVAASAMRNSETLQSALGGIAHGFPSATFPDTALGNDLKDVAALIYGKVPTKIFYVHQTGYDTHGRQVLSNDSAQVLNPTAGTHADLLQDLDQALHAFVTEMRAQGNWNRILLFTFSEFGRKVAQNGSAGTDHGAGASTFALGGGVNPGFYGSMPSLAPEYRVLNGSLGYSVDFRRIYRTVLERWLALPAESLSHVLPAIPSNFAPIPFLP